MSGPRAVMIFAAGRGTRMGALTDRMPKPLIEVAGRALIDHALDLCADYPVKVANTHHLPEVLEAHLMDRGVTASREETLLDTGGGLKAALPLLPGEALVTLNSDAVWAGENPLPLLWRAWDAARMDALLALVPLSRAHGRAGSGDFTLAADGRLSRGGDWVYTGAQIVARAPVAGVPDRVFSLNRVWDAAGQARRLYGIGWPGHWADVGHPGGIAAAEEMLSGTARV